MKATISALALTCLLFTAASAQQTIRPFLWQAGMARSDVGEINVFRRFPADRRAQVEAFYAEALGLTALPPTAPGGGPGGLRAVGVRLVRDRRGVRARVRPRVLRRRPVGVTLRGSVRSAPAALASWSVAARLTWTGARPPSPRSHAAPRSLQPVVVRGL